MKGGGDPATGKKRCTQHCRDENGLCSGAPPTAPTNTAAQTPSEANETKQNGENPFTDLRVSEVLFHRVIFGVAYASHPLDTFASGQPCNLPKTSSPSPAETTRLRCYDRSCGATQWAGIAEMI